MSRYIGNKHPFNGSGSIEVLEYRGSSESSWWHVCTRTYCCASPSHPSWNYSTGCKSYARTYSCSSCTCPYSPYVDSCRPCIYWNSPVFHNMGNRCTSTNTCLSSTRANIYLGTCRGRINSRALCAFRISCSDTSLITTSSIQIYAG